MKVFLPATNGRKRWVVTVGCGDHVAFHVIAESLQDIWKAMEDVIKRYFPGLTELDCMWIRVRRVPLRNVEIPDERVMELARSVSGRKTRYGVVPPELAVTLDFKLSPILTAGNLALEGDWALGRRDILCKDEACALVGQGLEGSVEAFLVEKDGKPVWKIRLNGKEHVVEAVAFEE